MWPKLLRRGEGMLCAGTASGPAQLQRPEPSASFLCPRERGGKTKAAKLVKKTLKADIYKLHRSLYKNT